MDKYIAQFEFKKWHPLNDLSGNDGNSASKSSSGSKSHTANVNKAKTQTSIGKHSRNDKNCIFAGLSSNDSKVLYSIVFDLDFSTSERMNKLNMSGRAFENAKHELITKGFVIESGAGRKKYLMPKPEVFETVGLICPYPNKKFIDHSFYLCITKTGLRKKADNKSVTLEYKIGTSGHTADIVTQSYDGILTSYELTLSASNIIQNCLKYNNTAFTKIIFLCRNTDLMTAVKSRVFNAGLSLELLAKIEFMLLSRILKK